MPDDPPEALTPTFFMGPPPAFVEAQNPQVCPDVDSLAAALAEVEGKATVVVTADLGEKTLAALAERFPAVVWWQGHEQPCADRYARHGLPRALAHAVRSPLGVLEGAFEELRDRFGDRGPEWGMVQRGLARLRRLSTSLSDVASLSAEATRGHAPTEGDAQTPLRDVVERAWEEARAQLPTRREVTLEVAMETLDGRPTSRDSRALERALRELFVNARQHGASRVHVRAGSDGHSVRLDVTDDGPGPGPAQDPANWAPFVPARERRASSDLALGLGVAQADARRLGGQLQIEERDNGAGTHAQLTWPAP